MVQVVNVVGGGDLGRELDLHTLSQDLADQVYKVEQEKSGLHIYPYEDSPLVILYRSGKYMITGAKEVSEAESTYEGFLDSLSSLGIDIYSPTFEVYNLVFKASIPYEVNLEKLVLILGFERSEYEPEQSPFLVYRPKDYDCVVTISSSGECVINGTTDVATARNVARDLESIIKEEFGEVS